MKQYLFRLCKAIFGLFLFALGSYMIVQANIGLSPWTAFYLGISKVSGIPYGSIIILAGILILSIAVLLKEKVGLGTIVDTLLVGTFVNLFERVELLPLIENFYLGLLLLLLGQFLLCLATVLYLSTELGGGPRDSLMVALGKRLEKVPIGAVRGGMEALVLLIGWLLGAKVGLGTAIAALTVGIAFEASCRLLKCDVKFLQHESLYATYSQVRQLLSSKKAIDAGESKSDFSQS